jgi:ribosomal protein S18 acetylase RimI-like enzyme
MTGAVTVTDTTIDRPASPTEVEAVKQLFREYAAFLGEDLCFQGFDDEMARFPSTYDFLLLARVNDTPAGAVGLKDLGEGVCEMKRLFTRDAYRGMGLGKRLSEQLMAEARAAGYRVMVLDTLERLTAARGIYARLGFVERAAYYKNPLPGVIYMEKRLDALHEAKT